jgi:hypothetical protein
MAITAPKKAATPVAPVKKINTVAKTATGITAYCVKTKEKNVPMLDAVIDIQSGRYIAKGVDAAGNKLTAIMSAASAEGHIKSGAAKKGIGWGK